MRVATKWVSEKKKVGVVRKNAWKKNDIERKNTKLY